MKCGFTLIELMICIACLGIGAALILGSYSECKTRENKQKQQDQKNLQLEKARNASVFSVGEVVKHKLSGKRAIIILVITEDIPVIKYIIKTEKDNGELYEINVCEFELEKSY